MCCVLHGTLWLPGGDTHGAACALQALPNDVPWQHGDSPALAMGVAVQPCAVQTVLAVVAVAGGMGLVGL